MLKEYGAQVVVSDLVMRKFFGDRRDYDRRIYQAFAIGSLWGMNSDAVDWLLNHSKVELGVQRDESLRATEVNVITVYDDEEEQPPSDTFTLEQGKPIRSYKGGL